MAQDLSAFQKPPMYCLFQARVPTREGKKQVDVIFDHESNHEAEDKKKKGKNNNNKRKKPYKTQLREKKEHTNYWIPPTLVKPPGWLVWPATFIYNGRPSSPLRTLEVRVSSSS